MRKKLFYQISTSGRTADINIYGDITGNAELINAWMKTDTGAVSARGIVQEIQDLDVDTINVYINSYGGEVAEALAIYSALKRHSASVHTFCDGFACSAATIIFCAGDVRTMGSIALLMIHNCMSYLGYANSNEMRKAAEDNDKINQSSINAYMAVVNISQEQVQELMDKATWLTAEESLQYGFATEIADQESDQENPEQDPHDVAVCSYKEEQHDTDHHDKHRETAAAALVKPRALSGVFYGESKTALEAVNAFVLRSVILVKSADILHSRDRADIEHKDQNAQNTFDKDQKILISHFAA